ncbi:hypothetical protein [Aeromicrobium sp.]|uniref:hypothetical protein n=1 Tax=Aeromicrobium sp. TaxID=1871063 RepID=UPI002FC8DBB9
MTSLVAALGGKYPDSTILYDYDFSDGPDLHGFEQLYSGTYNPPIGWDRHAMWIGLENTNSQIATAIKRLSYYERFNRITVEAWVSLAQWYGDNNVRSIEIGVDQADNAGARNYYSLRRVFTKTTGADFPTNRFDVKTGTDAVPSYTILPGHGAASGTVLGAATAEPDISTFDWSAWPPNENKRNVVLMGLEIDPVANEYRGVRFNDTKQGTLRDSGAEDATISALTGQSSTLTRFANGLNVSIDLRALNTGSRTAADAYVERIRVTGRNV